MNLFKKPLDDIKLKYPSGGPDAWEKIYYEVSKLIDNDDKIHSISIKIYDFLYNLEPIH